MSSRALGLTLALALAFGLALLAGCGGSDATQPTTRIPRVDPPPTSGLVWMVDGQGRHRTFWVGLDGGPLASQSVEGPLWGWDDTLWQWWIEPVEVPIYGEDALGEGSDDQAEAQAAADPVPAGTTQVARAVLRELTEDVTVVVIDAPEPGIVREVNHEVTLHASVGPYLFVSQSSYVDAFGAHGSSEHSQLVWDLRAAGPAQVLTDRERASLVPRLAARAARRLAEEGAQHGIDPDLGPDDVELVAIWPSWDLQRGLQVQMQFAAEACYACSDGKWSAYTRSVRLVAERVPERLAEHASIPGWVRLAAARVPDGRVAGFTRVREAAPARILDSLRR